MLIIRTITIRDDSCYLDSDVDDSDDSVMGVVDNDDDFVECF